MKNLSKQQHNLAKLWFLTWHQKLLLAKVLIVLTAFKGLMIIFPFNQCMMSSMASSNQKRALSEKIMNELVWAVKVVSAKIPLGFTCLTQALAAKWLLNSHPDIQLHIGVRKNIAEDFSAHAWVVYKNRTILGEQKSQMFEPILEWN